MLTYRRRLKARPYKLNSATRASAHHRPRRYRTIRTSPSNSAPRSASRITPSTHSSYPPPVPAPINGNPIDRHPSRCATASALRTDSRIDRSDARHHMLIPASWIIALYGSRPAPVTTAPPSGITPFRPNSQNTPMPCPPLDRPRYPLWQQQPPRNHIPIPRVNNHLHLLLKQIAFHNHNVNLYVSIRIYLWPNAGTFHLLNA